MPLSVPEVLKTVAGSDDDKPKKTAETLPKSMLIQHCNSFAASFASLLFIFAMGMTISYPAPATVDMRRSGSRLRDITDNEITWIGSLTMLGGVPANILGGYLTHTYGRKAVLMIFSPLFLSSWLMITYASTVEWLYAGRTISGFCTGLYVVACPAYIAELAPKEIRGLLTSGFTLASNLGVFFVMGLGISLRWSWLALSVAVCITCATCLMYFMPESPAWLVKMSKVGEASKALKFLRGKHFDTKKEIEYIIQSASEQKSQGVSFRDLLDPTLYKPMCIAALLLLFYSTTGFVPVITFTVELFKDAKSTVSPDIAATVLTGVQILASVVCGSIIEKFGRRKLYIMSSIGTCLILFCLGSYSLIIRKYSFSSEIIGYAPLVFFIIYSFFFTMGMGTIPFIIISEIVPIRFRSALLSLSFLCGSLFGFASVKSFYSLRDLLGSYGLYWAYSSCTLISVFFGYFVLPETRNLTIDEISKSFTKNYKFT